MYSILLMAAMASTADAPNWGHRGCHGCHGCWGCHGCYGGCYGCYGCWGGCYGCYGGCYGCYGGCYGCWGCYGGCHGCWGGSAYHMIPVTPAAPVEVAPPPKEKKEGASAPNAARVVVELPTDAKLFFDDQPMKTPSSKRTFNTPSLQRGQAYYYVVRAAVTVDGKEHSETKQVIVRAGDTVQVSFAELTALVNKNKKPVQTAAGR